MEIREIRKQELEMKPPGKSLAQVFRVYVPFKIGFENILFL